MTEVREGPTLLSSFSPNQSETLTPILAEFSPNKPIR